MFYRAFVGWLASVVQHVRSAARPRRPEPVPAGQASTVAEVVERLRAEGQGLAPGDGVRHFNGMYLLVTERVGERLAGRRFTNPLFLERLDVVFAGLYLQALTATPDQRNPAWRPLFESRSTAGVRPIQYAVAGMNAHINHDLALATVRACRQIGITPTTPGVQQDYLLVNAVLAEVHEEVRQSMLRGPVLQVDREASPLLNLVGSWSVDRAREAAWHQALVLWELQHSPTLTRTYLDTLARNVGLVSRQLLTVVTPPLP